MTTATASNVSSLGSHRHYARFGTTAILALWLICFYYLSYRYPLQINSSGTSPTYADTPTSLQVGKYVLIIMISLLMAVHAGLAKGGDDLSVKAGGFLILLAFGFVTGLKAILTPSQEMLELSASSLAAIAVGVTLTKYRLDGQRLCRFLSIFTVVALAANAFQYFLFRTQGRLPALAYEGSVSVRFGSLFDDPNGFGIIIALLLPFSWIQWRQRPFIRLAIACGLLASLVGTQSFTSYLATGVAVSLTILLANRRKAGQVLVYFYGGLALTLMGFLYLRTSDTFALLLDTKRASIEGHFEAFDVINALTIQDLLGLSFVVSDTESGWVALTLTVGIVGVIALAALGVGSVRRLLSLAERSADSSVRAVAWGIISFQIATLVGMANLPFQRVFPVFILYLIFVALSYGTWRPRTLVRNAVDRQSRAPS